MKPMLCSSSTRWVAKNVPPNLWAIFCGEESGSHCAVFNALWWTEGDGTRELSANVQINTFHHKWQLTDQVSLQQVLTFEQLRHEESSCRSSHVIISWPCLLDGLPPFFTAIKLAVALMIISRYNQPSTTTTPPLSKEAPVHLNEGCESRSHAGFRFTATLCFAIWQKAVWPARAVF